MAMSAGQRDDAIADINVTPMADVMIVLLIIFMVATPMISAEKVRLPGAPNSEEKKRDETALVLQVDAQGQLTVDGRDLGPVEPALRALGAMTGAGPDRPVRIKADRDVPYAAVEAVIEACRSAGAEVLTLATEKVETR
jgi:biopolymer transport protein ExbD